MKTDQEIRGAISGRVKKLIKQHPNWKSLSEITPFIGLADVDRKRLTISVMNRIERFRGFAMAEARRQVEQKK